MSSCRTIPTDQSVSRRRRFSSAETSTFVGVTFACALIGFWTLRLVGIGRGDLSLGWALAIVAGAGVVAAVVTRAVGRR